MTRSVSVTCCNLAHVVVDTATLEDLGDGRTRVVSTSLFHTKEERDGMVLSGMEQGLAQSYAALDRLPASGEHGAETGAHVH